MILEVRPLENIQLQPESVVDEIVQNINTILSTPKGTVPLDRDFGIDWSFVDSPQPAAQMMLRQEIVSALKKYEPRVVVLSISFRKSDAADGQLIPVINFEIRSNGTI